MLSSPSYHSPHNSPSCQIKDQTTNLLTLLTWTSLTFTHLIYYVKTESSNPSRRDIFHFELIVSLSLPHFQIIKLNSWFSLVPSPVPSSYFINATLIALWVFIFLPSYHHRRHPTEKCHVMSIYKHFSIIDKWHAMLFGYFLDCDAWSVSVSLSVFFKCCLKKLYFQLPCLRRRMWQCKEKFILMGVVGVAFSMN